MLHINVHVRSNGFTLDTGMDNVNDDGEGTPKKNILDGEVGRAGAATAHLIALEPFCASDRYTSYRRVTGELHESYVSYRFTYSKSIYNG